ncbi:MAG: N-acetyltransferase [SAR324 cluster bacterium]|nr:N-acetyltransferase [SAR324 cluster bacterium]MBL7035629.1 N-acetyltransferase [SAR324 cluster bacterium]
MQLRIESSIAAVSSVQWNNLSGENFPFSRHEFLSALEESGCANQDSGWLPCHLTLWENEQLQGAVCLYEKKHGYGEYIFDWGWARAYEQHGFDYYPKLISAVPFTPATGKKLLVHAAADHLQVCKKLLAESLAYMRSRNCSSLHFLFITVDELPIYEELGFLIRHSYQFHWKNNNYCNFNEFLAQLKRKRRKEILRERSQVSTQNIKVVCVEGNQVTLEQIREMYQFYLATTEKKWGRPYLSEDFFVQIHQTMRRNLVLFLAFVDDECVAGTINFIQGNCLYGRYWGCSDEYRSLHFEMCYYQPVEYAIKKGLELFEAGAQGEHKIQRGFLPELTYSAHWIEHAGFRRSISEFLAEEKAAISQALEEFSPHSPYR